MPHKSHFGFTITELMITVAVIGILAAIALPSFADLLERNSIKGAAESVKAEFQYARSEAIKQDCDTTLNFTAGTNWQTEVKDCNGNTITDMDATSSKVSLSAITFTSDNVAFDSRRGGADESANITLSTDSYDLAVRIIDGRIIDICYPAASKAIAGYGEC